MAIITAFERADRVLRGRHPTKVVAKYLIDEVEGRKVLQLNTYGSNQRQVPGKLSQTLQIDDAAARELFDTLIDRI